MSSTYRLRKESLEVAVADGTGERLCYRVLDPRANRKHHLYELEYKAAQLFDGARSIAEIAALLADEQGFSPDAVDVDRFAKQLVASGLLLEAKS